MFIYVHALPKVRLWIINVATAMLGSSSLGI